MNYGKNYNARWTQREAWRRWRRERSRKETVLGRTELEFSYRS
jgi:hypothetical protein